MGHCVVDLVNHKRTTDLRKLDSHRLLETLLVYGKLDGDVG